MATYDFKHVYRHNSSWNNITSYLNNDIAGIRHTKYNNSAQQGITCKHIKVLPRKHLCISDKWVRDSHLSAFTNSA